jgi:hypothetical protein
MYSGV